MEELRVFSNSKNAKIMFWFFAAIEIALFLGGNYFFKNILFNGSFTKSFYLIIGFSSMALSIILYITTLLAAEIKPARAVFLTFVFVNYINTAIYLALFFIDGHPEYKYSHLALMFAYDIGLEVVLFLSWVLVRTIFYGDIKVKKNADKKIAIIISIFSLLPIANIFTGILHYLDENGVYVERGLSYFTLAIQLIIVLVFVLKTFRKSKVSLVNRIIFITYYLFQLIWITFVGKLENTDVFYHMILFGIMFLIFGSIITARETEIVTRELKIASTTKELDVASNMQYSMLPTDFETLRDHGIDVYGSMNAAKEVGGDFYDFFAIDDDRTAYVMGDVSGKGIPAALLMTVGKTLIKKSVMEMDSLSAAITSVHKVLCTTNTDDMFITLFAAVIDSKNNTLTYVNAAHTKTYIKQGNEDYRQLNEIHGSVMGCVLTKNREYRESVVEFNPGDRLFMYTDGVTEAKNIEGKMYKPESLEKQLNKEGNITSMDTGKTVYRDVITFQGDAEQFDDITMLAVNYVGK